MPALLTSISMWPNWATTALMVSCALQLVGNVSCYEHGVPAVGGYRVLHFNGGVDAGVVVQCYSGARLRQALGDYRPNPPRRARDQGHLSIKADSVASFRHQEPSLPRLRRT